jgi:hypothetical protein
MIVIRASGAADVKSVKKLAKALSAEPADVTVVAEDPPQRKRSRPTVSPLSGAIVAPAAHGAILELQARECEVRSNRVQ